MKWIRVFLPLANLTNKEARRVYGALFNGVSAVLFRHDPVGLNFEDNTDEYDFEARTILPRLSRCVSEEDALQAIYEEFQHSFGADIAGPVSRYRQAASDIWVLWQRSAAK